MKTYIQIFVCAMLAFGMPLAARDSSWYLITNQQHKCTDRPCTIHESNGDFQIKVIPGPAISISNGTKSSVYNLDEVNDLDPNDYFKIYAVDLRDGSTTGIAFLAYSSAKEGEMFYYFLYNDNQKKFVMSDEPLPKLFFNPRTKEFVSALQGNHFVLGKDLKLREKGNKQNLINNM